MKGFIAISGIVFMVAVSYVGFNNSPAQANNRLGGPLTSSESPTLYPQGDFNSEWDEKYYKITLHSRGLDNQKVFYAYHMPSVDVDGRVDFLLVVEDSGELKTQRRSIYPYGFIQIDQPNSIRDNYSIVHVER